MPVCFHQAHLSTANSQLPVLSNLATVSLFHLKLSKIYEFWYIGESLPRCCLQNLNGLSITNASSWIKIARKFDLFVCQPVNLPSFLPSFFPPFFLSLLLSFPPFFLSFLPSSFFLSFSLFIESPR